MKATIRQSILLELTYEEADWLRNHLVKKTEGESAEYTKKRWELRELLYKIKQRGYVWEKK